jgi:hypothetical protein
VHAILGTAYNAFGDIEAAAAHIARHFELVTTELVATTPLVAGGSLSLEFVPGRTYEIPIAATAGQTISIATSSRDYWDTIAVLLAPDGTPVVGSDDDNAYFAAFDLVAEGPVPAAGHVLRERQHRRAGRDLRLTNLRLSRPRHDPYAASATRLAGREREGRSPR